MSSCGTAGKFRAWRKALFHGWPGIAAPTPQQAGCLLEAEHGKSSLASRFVSFRFCDGITVI